MSIPISTRIRYLFALSFLAWCQVVTGSDSPSLWQGPRFGACALELHFDQGRLEVESIRGRPRLEGVASSWHLNESRRGKDGRVLIELVSQASSAEASPDTLRLALPSRCKLRLVSPHGDILLTAVPRDGLEAESQTGAITLYVPEGADYAVSAATSGPLTVDFDLALDYLRHAEPAKRGRLTLGAGTIPVTLQSKRGAVRVLMAERRSAQTAAEKRR